LATEAARQLAARFDREGPPERRYLYAEAEARFKRWDERYLSKCGGWATCELVSTLGNTPVHPTVQAVLTVHDETTRAASGLPLA
jgi:hypothetical protein